MSKRNFYIFLFSIFIFACKITILEKNGYKPVLQGQPNFRDIGGYKTSNGSLVKNGLIYRSGTLSHLSNEDTLTLKEYGIKTVINFLTTEEILSRGGDKLASGIKTIHLPIDGGNNEASLLLEARTTGDFSKIPKEFNYNIHRLLPEEGKDAYSSFFKILSDTSNYPIVFHCSHGVHRTGTATALLLSLLDVSWPQIKKDYIYSNECRAQESQLRIKQLDAIARENSAEIDFYNNMKNIKHFYILKEDYILGTKEYIENSYGSFSAYFSDIGVSEKQAETIKRWLSQ